MDDYKFAVIYGDEDNERDIQDGKIEKYGDIDIENSCHIDYLLNYINNKYYDVKMFKSLNNRHAPEIAAFLISRLGHAVFLNATSNIKKRGKTGIFIMPDEISEKQRKSIYSFCNEIKDFQVTIFYNLKIVDGFLDGDELISMNGESSRDMLDSFFIKKSNDYEDKNIK